MVITYKASKLSRLIAINTNEPIEAVKCGAEEYQELLEDAKNSDLVSASMPEYFSLKGFSFLIHLDDTMD